MKKKILLISSAVLTGITGVTLIVRATKRRDVSEEECEKKGLTSDMCEEISELFDSPSDVFNVVSVSLWEQLCRYKEIILENVGKQRMLAYRDGVLTTKCLANNHVYTYYEKDGAFLWRCIQS